MRSGKGYFSRTQLGICFTANYVKTNIMPDSYFYYQTRPAWELVLPFWPPSSQYTYAY